MDSIEKAKIKAATRDDTKADYLHSSGYAQVQNGERIGTTSLQSFRERQALEGSRKFVRNYRSSKMGAQADGGWHARTSEEDAALAGKIGSFGKREADSPAEKRAVVSAKQRNPIAERQAKR